MAPSPRKTQPAKKPVRASSSLADDDPSVREETAFLHLAKVIAVLKQQSIRVKVEGLKESIENAAKCLETFATARELLQGGWRAKMEIAGRDAADSRAAHQVVVFESRVIEVLQRIDSKLAQQDGVLQALNAPNLSLLIIIQIPRPELGRR